MPCPRCGSETPEAASFCPRCGTTLAGPAPGPPPTAQNQQVRCQACGASAPSGARFCPQCGADLAQPKREPKAVSKKPTGPTLRGCLGAFGFVIGLFIVAGIIYGLFHPNERPSHEFPSPGEVWETRDDTFVPVNEKAYDRLVELSLAKDDLGIQRMIADGRVLELPAETKLRILDIHLDTSEVRILQGDNLGERCLVLDKDIEYAGSDTR